MLVEDVLKCSESTVGGGKCITEANIKREAEVPRSAVPVGHDSLVP